MKKIILVAAALSLSLPILAETTMNPAIPETQVKMEETTPTAPNAETPTSMGPGAITTDPQSMEAAPLEAEEEDMVPGSQINDVDEEEEDLN